VTFPVKRLTRAPTPMESMVARSADTDSVTSTPNAAPIDGDFHIGNSSTTPQPNTHSGGYRECDRTRQVSTLTPVPETPSAVATI
jgi:hypothetical protein